MDRIPYVLLPLLGVVLNGTSSVLYATVGEFVEKVLLVDACAVGAFYAVLGHVSVLRVSAHKRSACDDCMDCFAVCPEPQVIPPALKPRDRTASPLIFSAACTNCGRCIDVCSKDVFTFTSRFDQRSATT